MVIAFAPGHPWSDMKQVPLEEIANQRYVDRLYCEFREEFFHSFAEGEFALNVVFRCQREDWIQILIRDELGVSLIPPVFASEFRPRVSTRASTRKVELAFAGHTDPRPALKLFIEQATAHDWSGLR